MAMEVSEQYEIVDFENAQVTICFVSEAAVQTVEAELEPVEQDEGEQVVATCTTSGDPIRPYACGVCGKTYSRANYMSVHMRTHTGEKPYSCEKCGARFTGLTAKQRHMVRHSGVRNFKCDYCEKSYLLKHELTEHVRVRHSGPFQKPCKCEICGHAYRYPFQLKIHMKVHSEEEVFKCNLCGADFSTNEALVDHLNNHSLNPKGRPLECPVCKKLFKSKDSRDCHVKIHNPIKPHKCDLCGKGFHRKNKLKVHRRTHAGKDPSKIKQHKEPEGPSKMFKCEVCDRTFALEFSLNLHVKRRHPDVAVKSKDVVKAEETEENDNESTVVLVEIQNDAYQDESTAMDVGQSESMNAHEVIEYVIEGQSVESGMNEVTCTPDEVRGQNQENVNDQDGGEVHDS